MNEELKPEDDPTQDTMQKPTGRSGSSILKVVLRIILVLLVGTVVGTAIYIASSGWIPDLTQQYFAPLETNQARIQDLMATQQTLTDQLDALQANTPDVPSGLIEDLESRLAAAALEAAMIQEALDSLVGYSYTQVPSLLATLTANQQANERQISALATAHIADQQQDDSFQTELIQVLALLSRANQYALHDNYGLAEDQLQTARELLQARETAETNEQRPIVLELLSLIDGAIEDLPEQPAIATLKLELAWKLTLETMQNSPGQTSSRTPTPTLNSTVTPTAEP